MYQQHGNGNGNGKRGNDADTNMSRQHRSPRLTTHFIALPPRRSLLLCRDYPLLSTSAATSSPLRPRRRVGGRSVVTPSVREVLFRRLGHSFRLEKTDHHNVIKDPSFHYLERSSSGHSKTHSSLDKEKETVTGTYHESSSSTMKGQVSCVYDRQEEEDAPTRSMNQGRGGPRPTLRRLSNSSAGAGGALYCSTPNLYNGASPSPAGGIAIGMPVPSDRSVAASIGPGIVASSSSSLAGGGYDEFRYRRQPQNHPQHQPYLRQGPVGQQNQGLNRPQQHQFQHHPQQQQQQQQPPRSPSAPRLPHQRFQPRPIHQIRQASARLPRQRQSQSPLPAGRYPRQPQPQQPSQISPQPQQHLLQQRQFSAHPISSSSPSPLSPVPTPSHLQNRSPPHTSPNQRSPPHKRQHQQHQEQQQQQQQQQQQRSFQNQNLSHRHQQSPLNRQRAPRMSPPQLHQFQQHDPQYAHVQKLQPPPPKRQQHRPAQSAGPRERPRPRPASNRQSRGEFQQQYQGGMHRHRPEKRQSVTRHQSLNHVDVMMANQKLELTRHQSLSPVGPTMSPGRQQPEFSPQSPTFREQHQSPIPKPPAPRRSVSFQPEMFHQRSDFVHLQDSDGIPNDLLHYQESPSLPPSDVGSVNGQTNTSNMGPAHMNSDQYSNNYNEQYGYAATGGAFGGGGADFHPAKFGNDFGVSFVPDEALIKHDASRRRQSIQQEEEDALLAMALQEEEDAFAAEAEAEAAVAENTTQLVHELLSMNVPAPSNGVNREEDMVIHYQAPDHVEDSSALPDFSLVNESEVGEGENCVICLEPLSSGTVVALRNCGHMFHLDCLDDALEHSRRCPQCREHVRGGLQGTSPSGSMSITRPVVARVAGMNGYEETKAIRIEYNIPDGIQQTYHENPGKFFHGVSKVAFLPNTRPGNSLLQRLVYAFNHGMTFQISNNYDENKSTVGWANIPHLSNIEGISSSSLVGGIDAECFAENATIFVENCNDELDQLGVPRFREENASQT